MWFTNDQHFRVLPSNLEHCSAYNKTQHVCTMHGVITLLTPAVEERNDLRALLRSFGFKIFTSWDRTPWPSEWVCKCWELQRLSASTATRTLIDDVLRQSSEVHSSPVLRCSSPSAVCVECRLLVIVTVSATLCSDAPSVSGGLPNTGLRIEFSWSSVVFCCSFSVLCWLLVSF